MHGWKPGPTLTEDELYLDLVFLITRSTQEDGRQGHMGCVIVREKSNNNDSIVAAAVAADRLITQNIDDNENHNEDGASMEDTKRDDNNRTNKIHNDIANDAKILCLEAESLDEREFFQRIIGAGTNTPLFNNNECASDIHAEINALGETCKSSSRYSTLNSTAYITIVSHSFGLCVCVTMFGISPYSYIPPFFLPSFSAQFPAAM